MTERRRRGHDKIEGGGEGTTERKRRGVMLGEHMRGYPWDYIHKECYSNSATVNGGLIITQCHHQ